MKSISTVLALLVAVLVSANAFSPSKPAFALSETRTASLGMVSEDNGEGASPTLAKPLQVATEEVTLQKATEPAAMPSAPKMMAKNLNTGEIKELPFNDPAMAANSNPFQLGPLGWFFVVYPTLVISNDFLHFAPREALNIGTYLHF